MGVVFVENPEKIDFLRHFSFTEGGVSKTGFFGFLSFFVIFRHFSCFLTFFDPPEPQKKGVPCFRANETGFFGGYPENGFLAKNDEK